MIFIDYRDARPIYEQVVEKFRLLILRGVLCPNDRLPSVRNLAYTELERQGYIYTVKGKGNFVSESNRFLSKYKEELFAQLREICKIALDTGITKEELIKCICEGGAYD